MRDFDDSTLWRISAYVRMRLERGSSVFAQLGETTKKEAVTREILQVLPEGLLMSGTKPFLLTGHPDEKNLADGERVNCYAADTGKVFKYTDTTGAERTVRIWRAWPGA